MKMTEIKIQDNRIRGFAAIINNVVTPLNNNNQFKEKFKTVQVKILLNAPNMNFAALIIIDCGEIKVKSIPNKPKEKLTKKQVGWDGLLEMNSQTFIAISMDRMSLFRVVIKWIKGEIKMRGIRKLLYLLKALKYLT
jgi:hypothetical protein